MAPLGIDAPTFERIVDTWLPLNSRTPIVMRTSDGSDDRRHFALALIHGRTLPAAIAVIER